MSLNITYIFTFKQRFKIRNHVSKHDSLVYHAHQLSKGNALHSNVVDHVFMYQLSNIHNEKHSIQVQGSRSYLGFLVMPYGEYYTLECN